MGTVYHIERQDRRRAVYMCVYMHRVHTRATIDWGDGGSTAGVLAEPCVS